MRLVRRQVGSCIQGVRASINASLPRLRAREVRLSPGYLDCASPLLTQNPRPDLPEVAIGL
eukprot:12131139-Alexandrium_andersonii.AAC.1